MTSSPTWPRRIAIMGACGIVGSSVAARLAALGIGEELLLSDLRDNVLQSHVIDIGDAQALLGIDQPRVMIDPEDAVADLVIVAASKPEVPGGDRRDFLAGNADLLGHLITRIEQLAGDTGIVLILTNPVDVLAEWLVANSSIGAERVLGYASNDSARMRAAVSRVCQVDPSRIGALVLGEHGAGQVPVLSQLTLDGAPLTLSADEEQRVRADIDGWFQRWSDLSPGRSSGWTTGVGVAELVRELAAGEVTPATATTAHLAGYPDTFMTVPTSLQDGRVVAHEPQVNDAERAALVAAGERITAAAADLPARA